MGLKTSDKAANIQRKSLKDLQRAFYEVCGYDCILIN